MNFWKRYPADYQRKTARLTLAQHGAYTLLLDEMYTAEAPLPADMGELLRICRAMTKAEQDAVRFVAERFFPVGADGHRHNKRAAEEIEEATPWIEAARSNGKLGGRPKKPRAEPKENPVGFQNVTQNEPRSKAPHSSDSSSSLRSEEPPGISALVGAGFDERTAAEFIAHKAKARAPLTPRAWRDHLSESAKAGWTPLAAAEKVMAKGWKGFEAKYVADEPKKVSNTSFYERDSLAKAARIHEITGGLASAKPVDFRTLTEVSHDAPIALGR